MTKHLEHHSTLNYIICNVEDVEDVFSYKYDRILKSSSCGWRCFLKIAPAVFIKIYADMFTSSASYFLFFSVKNMNTQMDKPQIQSLIQY